MNFTIKTTIIQEQEITIPCFPYFAINERKDQAMCIHSEDRCTHLFLGGGDLKHYYISGGSSSSFSKAFEKEFAPCSAHEYREMLDKLMSHVIDLNLSFFKVGAPSDQDPAAQDSLKFNLQNPEGDE
jgi:hypothetical protein